LLFIRCIFSLLISHCNFMLINSVYFRILIF
jgi:hypothetical protein